MFCFLATGLEVSPNDKWHWCYLVFPSCILPLLLRIPLLLLLLMLMLSLLLPLLLRLLSTLLLLPAAVVATYRS